MNRMLMNMISAAVLLSTVPAAGQAAFGHWTEDEAGMPAYHYTGTIPFAAEDEYGNPSNLPADPYFLLGNYRLSLVTHVSGIFQLVTAERMWARVNADEILPDYGSNHAILTVDSAGRHEIVELVGLNSAAADPGIASRQFGIGFARYDYSLGNGITCTRLISVRPSESINSGFPGFLVTAVVRNGGDTPVKISYREGLPVNFVCMGTQMDPPQTRPFGYSCEMSTGGRGSYVVADITASANEFMPAPDTDGRSRYETCPPSVYVYAIGHGDTRAAAKHEGNVLEASFVAELAPDDSSMVNLVIGLVYDYEKMSPDRQVREFLDGADWTDMASGMFARQWKAAIPDFSTEQDRILGREMYWNAHFVETSAKYSRFFGETFIPQGSVYSYHDGDNIANRDHLQAVLAACYTNPALAKSAIRYVMKHSGQDGRIARGSRGYGYVPPTIYQESDQQLYMFDAVAEYLSVTGDYAFLDEKIVSYPPGRGAECTVLEMLRRYFVYLRDEIGTGPHGLVRLLNSDWADSFLHRYSPNKYIWSAESHLNSAMALAVLPDFIGAVAEAGRDDTDAFLDAVEQYRTALEDAFLADLGNRKFSARAYLEGVEIGMDNVCIEPQCYLLQIHSLPDDRKREIWDYVKTRISDPEKTGIRTRERPLWDGRPEGEDGGIWFSLEYPMLLGVATFDREEAKSLLHKFTFDNFAKTYPRYWVGHWTAPDEVNSSLYRSGLYAFWLPVPDYSLSFQGFCSHPHTWPLYCYFKLYRETGL